jgi:hypothetical protein
MNRRFQPCSHKPTTICLQDLLDLGKGFVRRDAETGQLLLDRRRHADVLEYLFWINSFADTVYREVHGDKDTFPLAFAVAGKAHEYSQMPVPPGEPAHLPCTCICCTTHSSPR